MLAWKVGLHVETCGTQAPASASKSCASAMPAHVQMAVAGWISYYVELHADTVVERPMFADWIVMEGQRFTTFSAAFFTDH